MNQPQNDQAADSKAASDQPLIIKENQSTGGHLVIDTISVNAITVNSTGRWHHQGDVDATSSTAKALSISGGIATINGNTTVHAMTGLYLKDISQFSIKSPGKITLSGQDNGLSVGNICRFSSEGPMTLQAAQGTALAIDAAESFNHQGTLLAKGGKSGISISHALATITGRTTANSKSETGLYLNNQGQLILNDALEIKAEHVGIKLSDKSQLTVGDALAANAGKIGIDISDKSQLTVPKAATVQTETGVGVKVTNLSSATFKGPTTISSKRSFSIDLGAGASWNSRQQLSLESPFSTAIQVKAAQFEHQGPLSIQGDRGISLQPDAVVAIRGSGEEVSDITSENSALQIEDADFTHQGQLQLTSQEQGMVLSKKGHATIEGRLAVTTQTQPAVVLSGGATLDLNQTTTTRDCQQATGAAVQLASGSRWSSSGALAIKTSGERAVQLDSAQFNHQGTLTLNEGHALTIKGDTQTKGLRNVLSIMNAGSATIKVEHPLTLNDILLANSGAKVSLDSPQLSVNGVIDLTKGRGSSVTLNGSGTLQLDEVKCGPGSQLTINGNYKVSIGKVTFELGTTPAQLAFHLSSGNQVKIGQFILPKSSTPAPIIEITGSDLAIDFDLKNADVNALPAGRHSAYQAEEQGAPIRIISDASGSLRAPNTAQLTLIPAEDEMPVTVTVHQLTQAIAAEDPSGILQRQFYYSAVGQAAPIALLTNASSILIPTSSQLSSYPLAS
jgi:hypothetical protein